MWRRGAVAIVAFQLTWLACAAGAGNGLAWPGIAAGASALTLHLVLSGPTAAAWAGPVAGAGLGVLCESALVGFGLVSYAAPTPSVLFAPAWIVALWLAFGTTLTALNAILGRRWLVMSAAIGALLAPLSYLLGQRMGALVLADPIWPGLIAIATAWACAMPMLLALEAKCGRAGR